MITSTEPFRLLLTAALLAAASGVAAERQPIEDKTIFNGKDLNGWSTSKPKYWSVKDGAIIGHSAANMPKNEFIWSGVTVKGFLCFDSVIVEIKAMKALTDIESAQVLRYLKATGCERALLVNFRAKSLQQKRFILSKDFQR